MKLPKELTTVTPLSKILAAILFVALPFVGFFLGVRFQEMLNLANRQEMESNLAIPRVPTPTPLAIPTIDPSITANWKAYRNEESGFEVKYPPDVDFFKNKIKDFAFFNMRRTKDSEIITDVIELRIINLPFSAMTDEVASFGKCKSKLISQTGKASIVVALNSVDAYGHAGFGIGDMANVKGSLSRLSECTDFNVYKDKITPLSVYYFFLSPSGQTYRFELGGGKNYVKEGAKEIFDQILSTFKFIDQGIIIPPQVCIQDVKLCPDGKTYVSRRAPNCEFASCPN